MIETREGLADLDAILDTEGLDGVFIGPNDLANADLQRQRRIPTSRNACCY